MAVLHKSKRKGQASKGKNEEIKNQKISYQWEWKQTLKSTNPKEGWEHWQYTKMAGALVIYQKNPLCK